MTRIVKDSYDNPAIVLREENGKPVVIRQLAGSDRGRITSAPRLIEDVTNPAQIEWALRVNAEIVAEIVR